MIEYSTVNVKLSNSQLSRLKSAVKNKQGTTLRMNARMFNGNNSKEIQLKIICKLI